MRCFTSEESSRDKQSQGGLHATVEGIGIAFSGAMVAIALRSSALWAAALSSLPLWRRLDPLMVLGLTEEERRKLEEQQREARSEEDSEVGRVLDGARPRARPRPLEARTGRSQRDCGIASA